MFSHKSHIKVSLALRLDGVKCEPCPTRHEPEGGAYFQREMSLRGESGVRRGWVDHHKDGDQHGRVKVVND